MGGGGEGPLRIYQLDGVELRMQSIPPHIYIFTAPPVNTCMFDHLIYNWTSNGSILNFVENNYDIYMDHSRECLVPIEV